MLLEFVLWMLPWVAIAAAVIYAGYAGYQASLARQQSPPPDAGPDPVDELARVNTEISRLATQARKSLESARDAFEHGLRGDAR